jgi:hypothetical protein
MLTVKQLRERLASYHDDDVVILSRDSEGNGYSPLASLGDGLYVPDTTSRGEIYLPELTDELRAQGYDDEDTYQGDDGVQAVVLYPVN